MVGFSYRDKTWETPGEGVEVTSYPKNHWTIRKRRVWICIAGFKGFPQTPSFEIFMILRVRGFWGGSGNFFSPDFLALALLRGFRWVPKSQLRCFSQVMVVRSWKMEILLKLTNYYWKYYWRHFHFSLRIMIAGGRGNKKLTTW